MTDDNKVRTILSRARRLKRAGCYEHPEVLLPIDFLSLWLQKTEKSYEDVVAPVINISGNQHLEMPHASETRIPIDVVGPKLQDFIDHFTGKSSQAKTENLEEYELGMSKTDISRRTGLNPGSYAAQLCPECDYHVNLPEDADGLDLQWINWLHFRMNPQCELAKGKRKDSLRMEERSMPVTLSRFYGDKEGLDNDKMNDRIEELFFLTFRDGFFVKTEKRTSMKPPRREKEKKEMKNNANLETQKDNTGENPIARLKELMP